MRCKHCERDAFAARLCTRHYQQKRRGTLGKTKTIAAPGEGDSLTVRVTKSTKAALASKAHAAGKTLSRFAREVLESC